MLHVCVRMSVHVAGCPVVQEEAELAVDLEKLERERNIHIRELKRIAAEDSSK